MINNRDRLLLLGRNVRGYTHIAEGVKYRAENSVAINLFSSQGMANAFNRFKYVRRIHQ